MRIPARFIEHPVETVLASALLLLLLVGSAEKSREGGTAADAGRPHAAQQQKM